MDERYIFHYDRDPENAFILQEKIEKIHCWFKHKSQSLSLIMVQGIFVHFHPENIVIFINKGYAK
jgi:hypothetical protein